MEVYSIFQMVSTHWMLLVAGLCQYYILPIARIPKPLYLGQSRNDGGITSRIFKIISQNIIIKNSNVSDYP